jgi:glycosyltransferase involved in cell wall biosynthesis
MLMPSRLDFEVKGSDKALRAFARLVKTRQDVFLVMMGWGVDLGKAKKMIALLGISDHIYFHPYVVSKPRLVRLVNAVDIILDQFGSTGAYGTTTIETMSCGKPLIINIDWQKMQQFFDSKPPVMYANTEDEILEAMLILCNSESREDVGKKEREWVISNHSAEKNLSEVIEFIKSAKNPN